MSAKTIYVGLTGGFGSLSQVVPILEQLDPSKYQFVCSIAHGAAIAVQQLGLRFLPYPDVGQPAVTTPKGRVWHDLDQYWGRFGFADRAYFDRLIEARLRLVEALQPDAVLTQFCPPSEVIARVTDLPLICVTQSCWHPRGKSLSWWSDERLQPDYPSVTGVINAVLDKYHARPIERLEDLNSGDLTLIPSFPEFDPIDDPSVCYLGPLQWTSANSVPTAPDLNLAAVFARPVILVYTGHLHDSAGDSGLLILQQVVRAFRNSAFNILITTGLGQDLDPRELTAENIFVRQWVPVSTLLRLCRLFIHHGGHGSCMAGILNGVPSLVIPTFQEREFNARQLHLLGVGDFLLPDQLTEDALVRKVAACLEDVSLQRNLARWMSTLQQRAYGGAIEAAGQIDALMYPTSALSTARRNSVRGD